MQEDDSKKKKKKIIIILLILLLLLLGAAVIIGLIFGRGSGDDGSKGAGQHNNLVAIANCLEYSNLPEVECQMMEQGLRDALDLNGQEGIQPEDARFREGGICRQGASQDANGFTVEPIDIVDPADADTEYDVDPADVDADVDAIVDVDVDVDSARGYTSFIVDIPSLEQSYCITSDYDADSGYGNSTVWCLEESAWIYEGFSCKDQYSTGIGLPQADDLLQNMPHEEADFAVDVSQDGFDDDTGKLNLDVTIKTDKESASSALDDWIESNGANPDDYSKDFNGGGTSGDSSGNGQTDEQDTGDQYTPVGSGTHLAMQSYTGGGAGSWQDKDWSNPANMAALRREFAADTDKPNPLGGIRCGFRHCTSVGTWFIAKYTKFTHGGGNGQDVVPNLVSRNGGSASKTPVAPAIYSVKCGPAGWGSTCSVDTWLYGHVGLVVSAKDGKYITLQSGSSDCSFTATYTSIPANVTFYNIPPDKLK
ncbi:hypothetical protein FWF93_00060 [Candidatus Saccharibacteria bacterium]|nr:hypothetical protein [Candidatus Saccharibacteria bacterium]